MTATAIFVSLHENVCFSFYVTALSGRAYELCGRFDDAFTSYGRAADSSSRVDNAATRALAAAAHIGLGWVCIRRWQKQQHHASHEQQQPNHKIKERIFQVAHVHFITASKLCSSSVHTTTTVSASQGVFFSDTMKLMMYAGLAASLWDQR